MLFDNIAIFTHSIMIAIELRKEKNVKFGVKARQSHREGNRSGKERTASVEVIFQKLRQTKQKSQELNTPLNKIRPRNGGK